ncbi:MAG: rhodanese-like domain-containing protein [Saprospiraceae bacterium]|jgi:rhodanese-related sulfurtransferase|nr:rhodanese-like domain-containing protein [Saprospiraceae bacterium]MDP4998525.1 rhodanese-like domain-containing protein [Saprospiraceae bacterium]
MKTHINFSTSEPLIIDVRETWEYALGHIQHALNIPLGELPQKMEELKGCEREIIVYCQSGGRSGRAAAYLQSVGFDKVRNGGGIGEMAMHYPVA